MWDSYIIKLLYKTLRSVKAYNIRTEEQEDGIAYSKLILEEGSKIVLTGRIHCKLLERSSTSTIELVGEDSMLTYEEEVEVESIGNGADIFGIGCGL